MVTDQTPAVGGGSRERLIDAAVTLFTRQGYAVTGVKAIALEAKAPMGSFYFHFPDGKQGLGVAALDRGAEQFGRLLDELLARSPVLEDALAGVAAALGDLLEASGWSDGCPVATTALECIDGPPALAAASERALAHWRGVIARRAQGAGHPPDAAAALACNVLSLIEGAELQARVQRSRIPLDAAALALRVLAQVGE